MNKIYEFITTSNHEGVITINTLNRITDMVNNNSIKLEPVDSSIEVEFDNSFITNIDDLTEKRIENNPQYLYFNYQLKCNQPNTDFNIILDYETS